jgi:hypothetical protein
MNGVAKKRPDAESFSDHRRRSDAERQLEEGRTSILVECTNTFMSFSQMRIIKTWKFRQERVERLERLE